MRMSAGRSRKVTAWLWVACLATFYAPILCAQDFQSAPRRDFWDTDGTVYSVLATNGRVYVGGSFCYVAPRSSKVSSLDSFTASLEKGFPAVYGTSISALVDDGMGGWFIGG